MASPMDLDTRLSDWVGLNPDLWTLFLQSWGGIFTHIFSSIFFLSLEIVIQIFLDQTQRTALLCFFPEISFPSNFFFLRKNKINPDWKKFENCSAWISFLTDWLSFIFIPNYWMNVNKIYLTHISVCLFIKVHL